MPLKTRQDMMWSSLVGKGCANSCVYNTVLCMNYCSLCLNQDSGSPLLRSDTAFQLYLSALVKAGHEQSVSSAVRRRDTLLASSSTASLAQSEGLNSTPAMESTLASTTPTSTETASHASQPIAQNSSSQKVAEAVLSGQPVLAAGTGSHDSTVSPDLSKLAAAMGGGAGVPNNPIYVTLSERKSSLPALITINDAMCSKGSMASQVLAVCSGDRCLLCLSVIHQPSLLCSELIFEPVFLVVLSVLLENSGLLKAGAASQSEFEPTEGKVVKFSDVHGVDEAKEVSVADVHGLTSSSTVYRNLVT